VVGETALEYAMLAALVAARLVNKPAESPAKAVRNSIMTRVGGASALGRWGAQAVMAQAVVSQSSGRKCKVRGP
jgi:hypothetical protein